MRPSFTEKYFNEKLIELRKSKGLSQDELGNALGVSRQTISKWELVQSYPDFQRLVLLSDYFGLSLDALVKDILCYWGSRTYTCYFSRYILGIA